MTSIHASISTCRLCAEDFGHEPRPVLQLHRSARILIAGQAPGRKVHDHGVPFDDASGDRLRDWMDIDRATFYESGRVAIVPMAFCYPGKGQSGDLPPPPRCATTWRERVLAELIDLRLTLVIGQYALRWHLPEAPTSLTDAVRQRYDDEASVFVLPHPSPRNNIWMAKNPWYEADVVPALKARVAAALAD